MGSGAKSPPAPAPQEPVAAVTPVDDAPKEPANRAVARRADDATTKASLLEPAAGDNLDPLTQRKTLSSGSASLMG